MITVVGSSYQYQGEKLSEPTIIFVRDHHYHEEQQRFPIIELLENSICNPLKHLVVFDHVVQEDDAMSKYNCLYLPLFLANSCREFKHQDINADWSTKTKTFNFMINKVRHNRVFLLMLLEHFKLSNYEYTLCWKNTNVGKPALLRDTTNPLYQGIINRAELTIPPRQYLFGTERLLDQGLQYGHLTNSQVYQRFLQKNVFEPTCVSLITEPGFYEQETIVTEKTIMAMLAGTIPIWVGGWRIPDYMKSVGFDVFDDIVDHSYQLLTDPWDRCYYAIERNLKLLSDFDYAKTFLDQNQDRLLKNKQLLDQNCFATICQEKIKDYPELQKII